MRTINEKYEGNAVLDEDTLLNGMIVGCVSVLNNVTFQLNGMVIGDVILEAGATVHLNGMVNGNVINKGGHIEVFGTINGLLSREGGDTIVDPKAVVRHVVP